MTRNLFARTLSRISCCAIYDACIIYIYCKFYASSEFSIWWWKPWGCLKISENPACDSFRSSLLDIFDAFRSSFFEGFFEALSTDFFDLTSPLSYLSFLGFMSFGGFYAFSPLSLDLLFYFLSLINLNYYIYLTYCKF